MRASLDERSDERPAQLLEKSPAPVELAAQPLGPELSPEHKGVVGGHVENVVEHGEGPARRLPAAAVRADELVQVVHAAPGAVVVQDDVGLGGPGGADPRVPRVQRAQQHHVPVFLGHVGHQRDGGREGKLGREDRAALGVEQGARQLGLVFAHRAHHGEAPLVEEPPGQLVGGEKVVTCDVARVPQARGQVHHHAGALIPLGLAAHRLARVDLHVPRVAGAGVAGHPRLESVPGGLAGHVLAEGASTLVSMSVSSKTENEKEEGKGLGGRGTRVQRRNEKQKEIKINKDTKKNNKKFKNIRVRIRTHTHTHTHTHT